MYLHGSPATRLLVRNGYTDQVNSACSWRNSLPLNSRLVGKSCCLILKMKALRFFETPGNVYQFCGKDGGGGNSGGGMITVS